MIEEISVVILTFNSINYIKPCLDSLFCQPGADKLEIIVVDNGSRDNTPGYIRENYPGVILFTNRENLGACAARNQGVTAAKGRWVLSLDCDVVLEKDFLEHLKAFLPSAGPKVGQIVPKMLYPDKKTIYSRGIKLSVLRRFFDIGRGQADSDDQDSRVFGGCCGCVLYRKEMLEQIKEDTGYFDERFFFLVEDVDLSWRGRRQGWESWFLAGAKCYHSGNSSSCSPDVRQYLCLRNRYHMIRKNEGFVFYLLRIIPVIFYDIPRFTAMIFTNNYFWNRLLRCFIGRRGEAGIKHPQD